jgi:hypothetical protein
MNRHTSSTLILTLILFSRLQEIRIFFVPVFLASYVIRYLNNNIFTYFVFQKSKPHEKGN